MKKYHQGENDVLCPKLLIGQVRRDLQSAPCVSPEESEKEAQRMQSCQQHPQKKGEASSTINSGFSRREISRDGR